MSSPACADGYDTPAQQREDSTTFMSVGLSPRRPVRPGGRRAEVRRSFITTTVREESQVTPQGRHQ